MQPSKIYAYLWDFDGVLINSNRVRELGFEMVLTDFPKEQVSSLLEFHRINGGLSRYVKLRYFFEQIRGVTVEESQIYEYAVKFSEIMQKMLLNPSLLIRDSLKFIESNYENHEMHVISGSDQEELRFLCSKLGIASYFKSITGSPKPKNELIADLLLRFKYNPQECVMIGDSINDYDAAKKNGIMFWGYNNSKLASISDKYIVNFSDEV